MFFPAAVALLAISATCAYQTETLLAKHNPHTSYGVQKICQAVEQDSYNPFIQSSFIDDQEINDFDDETVITTDYYTSIFGGVQSGRRTRQEIKRCCNKYSQYEKKQCLKNVRENYLDNNCDKGINHICCKTEGTSRYTCFTKKSAGGRVNQFEQFDDQDDVTSDLIFQSLKQQERRRRHQKNQIDEQEQLIEELEQEKPHEQLYGSQQKFFDNQFTYLEQLQDENDIQYNMENQLNRKAAHQARQAARQAINAEQQAEEETREIAENLRQAQRQQQYKLVKSELNSQKAQVYGDIQSEFDTESIFDQERQRQKYNIINNDDDVEVEDVTQQILSQEIGQQTYQQKKQQAARDARRVAREIKRQGGSNFEAQQAAQEVYETEKTEAMLQTRQLVNQIEENQYETDNQLFDTTKTFDDEFDQVQNVRRPCSQSQQCQQKVHKATKVAALNACQKNAQREGQQTTKTCCEAGSIVGRLATRRHSHVCPAALHTFRRQVRQCGLSHQPHCQRTFVQCCEQQTRQQRVGQQIEQQQEILEQVINNQLRNNYF